MPTASIVEWISEPPNQPQRSKAECHTVELIWLDQMRHTRLIVILNTPLQLFRSVARQAPPILVAGGSGFYLKSFFSPIVDQIAIPPELRAEVDRLYESDGLEALQRALEPFCKSSGLQTIDWNNPRRVRMALMRCRASDQPLTALQKRFSNQAEPYENIEKEVCLLEREPTELHQRIALRVDQMLEEGLVDEVSKLREDGLVSKSTAGAAIGYRETLAFLAGDLPSIDALREEIIIHTRQLARKQRTWFRKQIPIDRILPAATATPESAFPSALPSAQR